MSVWTPLRALAERIYWWLEEREHRALTDTGEQVCFHYTCPEDECREGMRPRSTGEEA